MSGPSELPLTECLLCDRHFVKYFQICHLILLSQQILEVCVLVFIILQMRELRPKDNNQIPQVERDETKQMLVYLTPKPVLLATQ